jgi:hypothetical protein
MNRIGASIAVIGIIAAASTTAVAAGAEAPCVPDQHQSFICGTGQGAIRVFPETIAPSGKLAFGWRTPKGLPSGASEPSGAVENVLIRLPDGAVLGTLGSTYWASGEMRANRRDLIAAWSPDSRAVVEVENSRWETESLRFHGIGDGDVVSLDLRDLVERAVSQAAGGAAKGRVFRVREDLPVKLDSGGHLSFAAILFFPKSEEAALGFRLELMVKTVRSSAAARVVSIQRAKLPN